MAKASLLIPLLNSSKATPLRHRRDLQTSVDEIVNILPNDAPVISIHHSISHADVSKILLSQESRTTLRIFPHTRSRVNADSHIFYYPYRYFLRWPVLSFVSRAVQVDVRVVSRRW